MIKQWIKRVWCALRHVSGDSAYEQYLQHHAMFHAQSVGAPPPLSRKAFFKLLARTKVEWKS
jgi:hypothetical protein